MEMPTPTDVATVCKFIGFTNYLSKFLLNLSDLHEAPSLLPPPPPETRHTVGWVWTNLHDSAVHEAKQLVTNAPVLKWFDST